MRLLLLVSITGALVTPSCAQRHEIGLTLGRVLSSEQSTPGGFLDLKSGAALQANYGVRIGASGAAALFGEVHFLSSPLRDVASIQSGATRDFATLYIAPGVRVKFAPEGRFSPYLTIGGGYALYEQSTMTIGGQPNSAPRHIHRGLLQFGGGVDVGVLRWFGLRFEVRDFYTGKPALNVSTPGGLHNVVAGGGFVLRF